MTLMILLALHYLPLSRATYVAGSVKCCVNNTLTTWTSAARSACAACWSRTRCVGALIAIGLYGAGGRLANRPLALRRGVQYGH